VSESDPLYFWQLWLRHQQTPDVLGLLTSVTSVTSVLPAQQQEDLAAEAQVMTELLLLQRLSTFFPACEVVVVVVKVKTASLKTPVDVG
jgi:hypothetical protein